MKEYIEKTEVSLPQMVKMIKNDLRSILDASNQMESSSKLLDFCVNDMLSLAQINSNKFRKNCSKFDVRETIREIMQIQME